MIHPAIGNLRVEIDRKTIGQRIKKARRGRGWKQTDLAAALGVRPATVSNWETGVRLLDVKMIVNLAVHLRRSTDHILCGAERRGAIHRMARQA